MLPANISYKVKGNVLFLILIAVALFAALSYAITSSSRSGGDAISKDKAKIAASEIIQYATSIESAITRLRTINGCQVNQISFVNPITAGSYTNNKAPTDKSCHVFAPEGGNQYYWQPINDSFLDANALNKDGTPNSHYGKIYFLDDFQVVDVGTTCEAAECVDMIFIMSALKPEICIEINNKLGIQKHPSLLAPYDGFTNYGFTSGLSSNLVNGNYSYINIGAFIGDGLSDPYFTGKYNGCFDQTDGSNWHQYTYYHVLIAR
jgi:hypothetical protein